jgi:hypothetical protein
VINHTRSHATEITLLTVRRLLTQAMHELALTARRATRSRWPRRLSHRMMMRRRWCMVSSPCGVTSAHRGFAALQARATVATLPPSSTWRGARSWSWPWLPWKCPRSPCFSLRSGRCWSRPALRTWPPTAGPDRTLSASSTREARSPRRKPPGPTSCRSCDGRPSCWRAKYSQINHFRQELLTADVSRAPACRVISLISCPLFAFSEPRERFGRGTTTTTTLGERGLAAALFVHTPQARTTLFSSAWFPCA